MLTGLTVRSFKVQLYSYGFRTTHGWIQNPLFKRGDIDALFQIERRKDKAPEKGPDKVDVSRRKRKNDEVEEKDVSEEEEQEEYEENNDKDKVRNTTIDYSSFLIHYYSGLARGRSRKLDGCFCSTRDVGRRS